MSKVSSCCVKTIVYIKENPVKFNDTVMCCVNRLIAQLNDLYEVLINQKSLGVKNVINQITSISSTLDTNIEILEKYISTPGYMNAFDKKASELIYRRIKEFIEHARKNLKNEIDNYDTYREDDTDSREETIRNSHYNYNNHNNYNNHTRYNNTNTNYNFSNRRTSTQTIYVPSTQKYKCLESEFCSKIKERGMKRLEKLIEEDNITIK